MFSYCKKNECVADKKCFHIVKKTSASQTKIYCKFSFVFIVRVYLQCGFSPPFKGKGGLGGDRE